VLASARCAALTAPLRQGVEGVGKPPTHF
jgi:hypothetical protein